MGLRTYGLSGSGIDVDQMVKDLMKARRASYDKLYQKKTQLEWKKADYATMYSTLKSFRETTVFNYKLQNTLAPKKVASGNETVVTATANADAANVNHTITVTQLAGGVTLGSNGAITTGAGKDTLATQFGLTGGSFDIKITNGTTSKTITVDPTKSIYEFVSAINSAGVNIKANYDATLDRFFLYTTGTGAATGIDFTGSSAEGVDFLQNKLKIATVSGVTTAGVTSTASTGFLSTDVLASKITGLPATFNLKITNGAKTANITLNSGDTLQQVIGKINAAGVDAAASFDDGTGKFTLQATSGTLDLTGSDSAALQLFIDKLKLPANLPTAHGQDAIFTLDGVNLTQASNTFTISGVTYNLKAAGTAAVAVSPDNDKAIANVKAFIEAYNATLDKINAELKEERYPDYLPLTDEQRKEMSESQVTDWEKLAKSGMLRRDPLLQDVIYKMRYDIATPVQGVTGKYTSLSSIGITTGDYSEGGKLYLDETKLKAALEEDPDIVSKLFSSNGDAREQDGVAVRLYDTLKTALDKIKGEAGTSASVDDDTTSVLAKRIKDYEKQMEAMDRRLKDIEDRYYKQFDAMEVALSRMNQQTGWLLQQFSSQ